MKIIILGKNSYLANGIETYFDGHDVSVYSHKDIKTIDFNNVDWVIDFSINPSDFNHDISFAKSTHQFLALKAKEYEGKMMFISSRRVYGASDYLIKHDEKSLVSGDDYYSKNKAIVEKELYKILGDNLTIYRIPNVIGGIPHQKYTSFVGWVVKEFLNKNKIILNTSPKTIRDFVTRDYIHDVITFTIQNSITGLYNLSSNLNVELSEIMEAISRGFGRDVQLIYPEIAKDQFLLSNQKLLSVGGPFMSQKNLIESCVKLGEEISREFINDRF